MKKSVWELRSYKPKKREKKGAKICKKKVDKSWQLHGLLLLISAHSKNLFTAKIKVTNWCKSRYEEQRVFIVFLFLFELGFIYSSTLN